MHRPRSVGFHHGRRICAFPPSAQIGMVDVLAKMVTLMAMSLRTQTKLGLASALGDSPANSPHLLTPC